jgi:hypothetical protein
MARVLITNGQENHKPDDWAIGSAEEIFNTAHGDIAAGRLLAARDMQNKIAMVLAPVYARVMADEAYKLNNNPDHCKLPIDPVDLAKKAIGEIQSAARGCPWDKLLNGAEWTNAAITTLASHLATAMHTERLLHADKNPDNSSAQAYRAKFHGNQ